MRVWRKWSYWRRWRLVAGFFLSWCILVYLLIYTYISSVDCEEYLKSLRNSTVRISPPEISLEDSLKIRNSSGSTPLAQIVWDQITEIQGRDCHTPNFQCGHSDYNCGFACQIHHRAACLMMSYVMNMSLIHTANDTGWSFSTGFNSIFLPIGSDCTASSNTYSWTWAPNKYAKLARWCLGSPTNNLINGDMEEIRYPLASGLSVSRELAEAVAKVTTKPFSFWGRGQRQFLWWVGQFVKYTLRLNAPSQNIMEEYKRQVGFSSPIVGAHVRRTDKLTEAKESHHELEEYFESAEEYFSREEESRGVKLLRRIFIASDDSQVLPQARAKWPSWEVQGFQENVTLRSQRERKDALGGIVRDVYILSSCHFIICGHTSNVCTLLLELISLDSDAASLKSLDGKYSYPLWGYHSIPKIVNKKTKTFLESFLNL